MTARSADYYDGLRDGIRRYAWWKRNGPATPSTHVVGQTGALTLAGAIDRVDREEKLAVTRGAAGPAIPVAEVIEALDAVAADDEPVTALHEWRAALAREAGE